jgi:SAM-dependent methyltransferase
MVEVNLMDCYPRSRRPVAARGEHVSEAMRDAARRFGESYFDGDRLTGYGGYRYDPRFWTATVRRFRDHYDLPQDARILDIGCAKGFMIRDFKALLPRADIRGVDVSTYAIAHADPAARPFVAVASADSLPFADASFDLVISINCIHSLPYDRCLRALREMQRVSRGRSFLTVDAWRDDLEMARLLQWNLTGQTFFHVDRWKEIFLEVGYTGDYWWFIADET